MCVAGTLCACAPFTNEPSQRTCKKPVTKSLTSNRYYCTCNQQNTTLSVMANVQCKHSVYIHYVNIGYTLTSHHTFTIEREMLENQALSTCGSSQSTTQLKCGSSFRYALQIEVHAAKKELFVKQKKMHCYRHARY